MASKVYEREVRFARSFLKYARANEQNTYLLLAVIAWMRAEIGVNMRFMYNQNNPFNIRKSRFASGYRKAGNNGSFAMFANLDVAAKATVAFLTENARFGKYGPILAAMRRGTGKDKGVGQAIDFMTAISMSKWSSDHYGAADGNVTNNRIIKLWSGITGAAIPQSWYQDTVKVVKKRKIPRQPRALEHVLPTVDFIQPYTSSNFYDARPHIGQFILPREDA